MLIFVSMNRTFIPLVLGLLALSACEYNGGEVPVPEEGSILVSNRLSNQRVNCIIEDAGGLIWMGTQRGLNCFDGQEFIHVMPYGSEEEYGSFLAANMMAGRDDALIYVTGNDDRILISTVIDNLGKGASGAAIECMNIRMGLPAATGLNIK